MVEAGVNDVYGSSWICVNVLAGTPRDIIDGFAMRSSPA